MHGNFDPAHARQQLTRIWGGDDHPGRAVKAWKSPVQSAIRTPHHQPPRILALNARGRLAFLVVIELRHAQPILNQDVRFTVRR
jgi:hypothetical protein